MLKSYNKVWYVCRTYNVEVGKHSTEAAAEADLQKVLGSPNWADAQSTHLKAVEIAQKHADWLNGCTLEELIKEDGFNRRTVETTIQSDISGYEVCPSNLLTQRARSGHDSRRCDDGSLFDYLYVVRDKLYSRSFIRKPEIDYCWEITRWGRLRQKVANRLYKIGNRIDTCDPDDYDPIYVPDYD